MMIQALAVSLALVAADGTADRTEPPEPVMLVIQGNIEPSFAPTVGRLVTLFYESYPKLLERFEHPEKPAARRIFLHFEKSLKVPAYCSGEHLHISVEWLTRHPNDIALLTHELTHIVQRYPKYEPSWLTEGIADYARQVCGPAEQPGWSLPDRLTAKHSYRDSYRVTARFLVWLDDKHPGTVDQVHRKMQDGAFEMEDFSRATGKDIDTLWNECVADLSKP